MAPLPLNGMLWDAYLGWMAFPAIYVGVHISHKTKDSIRFSFYFFPKVYQIVEGYFFLFSLKSTCYRGVFSSSP